MKLKRTFSPRRKIWDSVYVIVICTSCEIYLDNNSNTVFACLVMLKGDKVFYSNLNSHLDLLYGQVLKQIFNIDKFYVYFETKVFMITVKQMLYLN